MTTTTDIAERIKLPGFGLALEQHYGLEENYGGPISFDWESAPLTVLERAMIGFMLAIKDKPNWDRKVFDDELVERWRIGKTAWRMEHALRFSGNRANPWNGSHNNGENLDVDGLQRQKQIEDQHFDCCIEELRTDAKIYQRRRFTEAIDANLRVYMSDIAVSQNSQALLNESIKPLENMKEQQKDWRPGLHGQVLNLVDPSLFPLIYGRSRILPHRKVSLSKCSWSAGEGEIVPKASPESSPLGADYRTYSDKFQLLPCEVSLDTNENAKIRSYINNLHPDGNENLYQAIEHVVTAAVPLWVQAILSIRLPSPHRTYTESEAGWLPSSETSTGNEDLGDNMFLFEGQIHEVDKPHFSEFGRWHRAWRETYELPERRTDTYPETNPMKKRWLQSLDSEMDAKIARLRKTFADQGLQVIVKLANIHLTPETPNYDGGSWDIEGQLNEHICASALYCYSSDNITDPYVAFREGVDISRLPKCERDRHQALTQIYGINDPHGVAMQVLGSVHTREGRLLVFPNILQHRVSPFELQDKSRPGHRKLLALFLVDPEIRILSTANVPPQQKTWWAKAIEENGALTQRLPVELADQVIDAVEDFPITLEEAKELRETLIEDHDTFIEYTNEVLARNTYL